MRREMSAGLDLREHLGPPGLKQVPEEPDRQSPAVPTGPRASPGSVRATAFMAHESFHEADVERVEAQPFDRQPDRDVPGRIGQ